jgi:hypothetical protein
MENGDEFAALILLGLVGLLCCMILIGFIAGLESTIGLRVKAAKEHRKRKGYYLEGCRLIQRLQRTEEHRRDVYEWLSSYAEVEVVDLQQPTRCATEPLEIWNRPPSYEEAAEMEAEGAENFCENLPNYEEALKLDDRASRPPRYEEIQEG